MSHLVDGRNNGKHLSYNYKGSCPILQNISGGIQMLNIFKRLVKEEEGQGMAEYGLILALIAVVVIGALGLMGEGIEENFNSVTDELKPSSSTPTT
jgi:pilus assembly protein Flp/PilA